MVSRRTFVAGAVAGGVILAAAGTGGRGFARDMAAARARVTAPGRRVFDTPCGPLEYAEAGAGAPVLMIHGTGGGFDQGLAFARPLVARGWRVIAPSRFGYLGSAMPADAGPGAQADAVARLLDHLGLDRVAVAGGSAGALSAVAFAIRHPGRCRALVALVPVGYVPGRPETPGPTGVQARAMGLMLRSDLVFWAATRLMREMMIGTMLATDPALVATASTAERARVDGILQDILPVSLRAAGLLNDARLARAPAQMDLAAIRAPTLALSLADDRFGTLAAARHIAAGVADGRLVTFPTGGHVWVGRDDEVFASIDGFLRDTA